MKAGRQVLERVALVALALKYLVVPWVRKRNLVSTVEDTETLGKAADKVTLETKD